MSHQRSLIWLRTAAIVIILVGLFFSWATSGPLVIANETFVDLAFWPFDGAQTYAADETRFLSGIAGGLTVGLGAAILLVAREVYAHDPARPEDHPVLHAGLVRHPQRRFRHRRRVDERGLQRGHPGGRRLAAADGTCRRKRRVAAIG